MVQFRPGSHVWQLVTVLSFVGEYPFKRLSLLGNERVLKALVMELIKPKTFRNSLTGEKVNIRLLTVSGKGGLKTVRLCSNAVPVLRWISDGAYEFYMKTYGGKHSHGDNSHIGRNHRVAEAAVFCMRAGFEARPYLLPKLQGEKLLRIVPNAPSFYLGRELKHVGDNKLKKTGFTRMTGAVFSAGKCYAVYNTRNAAMKWNGMGEFKALNNLIEIARLNSGARDVDSALLLGRSEETALKTLLDSDKASRPEFRFDRIYDRVYFIPMDCFGIRQLRLFTVPNLKERLLNSLFPPEVRSYDRGLFEYDALIENRYVISHLDGDIARLIRFREAIENQTGEFEILCFPHQTGFLSEYLGNRVCIKTVELSAVENALNIGSVYQVNSLL